MKRALAAIALLALLSQHAMAAAGFKLAIVPHPRPGQAVVLHVRTGVLRKGMQIDVYVEGALAGTVSPFAIRGFRPGGTYTIPLDRRLAHVRRLHIRLVLTEAGHADRAPSPRELRGVTLAYIPVE